LDALEGFLKTLPDRIGFEPGPLVLGGFSQGGTTSLAYAMTRPGTVNGVAVLSGFLPRIDGVPHTGNGLAPEGLAPKELTPGNLANTPVFWGHGTQDPAVPFRLALAGWERLRGAGVDLESREYRIGHWVSPDELGDLEAWLEKSVPGWV
jgi:phospholipase/carboxylesterase